MSRNKSIYEKCMWTYTDSHTHGSLCQAVASDKLHHCNQLASIILAFYRTFFVHPQSN